MPDPRSPPSELRLPPVFRPQPAVGASGFDEVAARLPADEAGAVVHAFGPEMLDVAFVLEPDQPTLAARRVLALGLDALAEALAAAAPPGTEIVAAWPDAIRVRGAMVGGVRLAAFPAEPAPDEPPDRLVLGFALRLAAPPNVEPGHWTRGTALSEEGLDGLDPAAFTELLAAHVLSRVDLWLTEGFDAVGARLARRLSAAGGGGGTIGPEGDWVAPDGRLLGKAPAVGASPTWLDPATGKPWL